MLYPLSYRGVEEGTGLALGHSATLPLLPSKDSNLNLVIQSHASCR